MGQGLLGVHVLAVAHGQDRGGIVMMIWRSHHHGVELLVVLVKHLAVVRVPLGIWPALGRSAPALAVRIGIGGASSTQTSNLSDVLARGDAPRGHKGHVQALRCAVDAGIGARVHAEHGTRSGGGQESTASEL